MACVLDEFGYLWPYKTGIFKATPSIDQLLPLLFCGQ